MPAVAAAGAFALIATTWLLWHRFAPSENATPGLRWEQLTNFNDAAEIPALSRDGKLVAFLRGPGSFGSSANSGQIWFRSLPDGEAFQLTNTAFRKQTINFSPDGTRLYFTQVEGPFTWNTYELPLLGGQVPKLLIPNATGLSWISDGHRFRWPVFLYLREGWNEPFWNSPFRFLFEDAADGCA